MSSLFDCHEQRCKMITVLYAWPCMRKIQRNTIDLKAVPFCFLVTRAVTSTGQMEEGSEACCTCMLSSAGALLDT